MNGTFLDALRERVLVFDGATGTHLQGQGLTSDDFGGEALAGCNEILVVSKPSAVENVHADYLEAGCDVVETNTFGASSIVLAEYGLEERAYELNLKAARIARRLAEEFSTNSRRRFVAGSLGPTTKLPSLGHIRFREMASAYEEQARGLLDGGVDLLCIETCQDALQMKAAVYGVQRSFEALRRKVPVIVSVTVELTGTMLLGTEIAAALTTVEPLDIDAFGLNCATGPLEMSEHIRVLSAASPLPIFVMPNAGIPENIGGVAHYHLTPEEFVRSLTHFIRDLGVRIVGGCCGTTKEHIRQLAAAVGSLTPAPRKPEVIPSVSSLYQSVPLRVNPAPVLVGERTNANGSKLFRDLLSRNDWEGIVAMGREQVREQAHLQDVCVAYVGRSEEADMSEVIERFNTQVTTPLLLDSTEPQVIEAALQRIGGKPIVNSINLEDGGERLHAILGLCKRYGAAVIALTIDEQGMAKTADRKLEVARRLYDLAVRDHGLKPHDIIFDALTFTLGSGDEEFRTAGRETLEAIRRIKAEFPETHTLLGVSNISFGLAPHARQALNSVFLHYAVEAGLDLAIVHASKIEPLFKIDERVREICRRLIFDERIFEGEGEARRIVSDPLNELLSVGAAADARTGQTGGIAGATAEERLRNRIIEGARSGLQDDLNDALQRHAPLEIINTILLDGMRVVGELFGSGQMQLPFVLQSAEVMKAAVSALEPLMEKTEGMQKGTLVIATVKGDVHDIGKNLVDIVLTNNGYKVVNLGIKCPVETMLHAAEEHRADAIGMSGLLVKSTVVMKENLEVMEERGLRIPVILGGAALTRRYVEEDLRRVYSGEVHYANDAFDGMRLMEHIVRREPLGGGGAPAMPTVDPADQLTGTEAKMALAAGGEGGAREIRLMPSVSSGADGGKQRSGVRTDVEIPQPPFWGSRVVEDIPLDDVFRYINETALVRGQWRVVKGKLSDAEYQEILRSQVHPDLERLKKTAMEQRLLTPKVVYGYFPCQSEGNDLVVYEPGDGRTAREVARFTFPRQAQAPFLCIADFFASKDSDRRDVVAFHLVTMGRAASEHSRRLFESHQYKEYLYFHGLSVESAEALAELWHRRIREELGIAGRDAADIRKLFAQGYQGSRYSFGYPACPNLEDQTQIFRLLQPERIDVRLTEEYQLDPEQSTSALIVHHPEARYFNVR
jgi:5-methyltetrahydrofolate--homocysteine methyltransferase